MSDGNRQMPQTYLLNTAILTGYGEWRFEGPVPVERAREFLAGGFVSAVGHVGAAEFLSRLLGVEVVVNRISVEMQPGDRAVVLRLKTRLPEGVVLTDEQMRSLPFELGLLTRLS
jgi:hypothetical protein